MELICTVQKYHWGKRGNQSLVGKFALANSQTSFNENETLAEFWMGTHPNGNSLVKSTAVKLSEHLNNNPEELGLKVISIFGNQLPFLFKVLSVEEPLSIQAHPEKSHAERLFQMFPSIYKDDNHKPEIAIAASKFEALCGFKPLSEIKRFLKLVEEFKILIDQESYDNFLQISDDDIEGNVKLMKECFKSLMHQEKSVVSLATEKFLTRLQKMQIAEQDNYHFELVKKINLLFPNDIGLFCIYWLNHIVLLPGEAIYLAPNEPHAYLFGDCLECMANSDNVVRAGLTPKFRDVSTLCEMLTYKCYDPEKILFQPSSEDEYSLLYAPPIQDFAVVKITIPKNCSYTLRKRESASILLVFEGSGQLNSLHLEFGKVLFIPSNTICKIESDGLVLYQAFCNV